MALRRFDLEAGGDSFVFRPETEPKIDFWLAKYPADKKRSAVIPMLWLAQKDNKGWLSEPAMRHVADRLDMPYVRVYEVATFYTMFRLKPVGRHHIQLCGTTPCMLRGANDLKQVCEEKIGPRMHVTDDGRLSWEEVECLGACANAPMVQINDDYYEDLTPEILAEIIDKKRNGVAVEPGPQIERLNSAPEGGADTLVEPFLFDGSMAKPLAAIPNAPGSAASAASEPTASRQPSQADKADATSEISGEKPETVEIAEADRDDLKRIKGIGPKNEDQLNELGIYSFAQIAAWTPANIDWVEDFLSFPGRIEREDWIAQAAKLADGKETEFSKRVDAGEVDSSKDEAD